MKRLLALTLLLSPLVAGLHAQVGGLYASRGQSQAVLPAQPESLSLVDGRLCTYSGGVLMTAQYRGDDLASFVPDTTYFKIDGDITYIVRHPATGDYYYTAPDRKGRSCLYVAHREPFRYRVKRVKMNDVEVHCPTFNAEGDIMVFSTREKRRSYGGYDLWYSRLRNGEWQEPRNLGNRVNSTGDELTPCIAGGYLFFASNGREESHGVLNIYATRLVSRQVVGDTVSSGPQLGRARVQHLPLCSATSDCYGFVVDSARRCCWWFNAATGLRRYDSPLQSLTQWGYVYDTKMGPLQGAMATAWDGDVAVASAVCGDDGFYRLTLPAGRTYRMEYRMPNHYVHQFTFTADADLVNLIGEDHHDVVLDAMPIGQPIQYTDLFGPDAVVDLSTHGIEVLQPLVQFLNDNPGLHATLTLSCDLTTDAGFNSLLTGHRLKVLEGYLREVLPDGVGLTTRNGCGGRQGCSDASGVSRLTVVLK